MYVAAVWTRGSVCDSERNYKADDIQQIFFIEFFIGLLL